MQIYQLAKKIDSLIVASKAKAYIKSKKIMTSAVAVEAVSETVYCMLDEAPARAYANCRTILDAQDR